MRACVGPPGLGHLESPALADDLSAARDFDLGLTGPNIIVSMPHIGSGFAQFGGGVAQLLLLFGYRWWAPLLLGAAWGSTHHTLRAAAIWHAPHLRRRRREATARRVRVQAHRRVARRQGGAAVRDGRLDRRRLHVVAASPPRPVVGRAEDGRARRHARAIIVVAVANVLFFWSLGRDASNGDIGVGALVVFAQAAVLASAVAFADWDWWLRTSAQPVPLVLDLADRMEPAGALVVGTPGRPRECRDRRSASRASSSPTRRATASCSTVST